MTETVTTTVTAADPKPRSGLFRRIILARPKLVRWLLSGPATILATAVVMMGMTHWFPAGAAHVDNIVMPIILFPLIWAGIFFYTCIEENLPRNVVVVTGLIVGHVILLAMGGVT
ncbi:MAG: hypothetical protein AAGF71_01580 [Pseudomonadota bacterium]